ncbi:MAG: primosomal protein N', partial [Eubacterium sp.]|nr:primosomal protein N' [Eubacterium sp.]
IVIGPRSALFVPFPDPGLIIIDEEQEPSYRNENAPRYDTREAAVYRASLENAHVVFGSATPSLDTYYRAEKGEYALFRLDNRYGSAELPEVSIVDMREELKAGNRSILSIRLQEKIADRLAKKEQVMLFLNRRGYSGVQTCRSCGHVIKCPHCDISLTLHTNGRMICHFCGYETPAVKACPSCGSHFISGFSYGTEKVEADLNRLFPEARVIRMDKDTTREKESYGKLLKNVADRKADILLGTQMIVKGHDFPGITLVGVLAADLSLHASDYRAEERTYQLLVQAVGRSGRGDGRGEAIIQTYNPESECIRDAVSQSYNTFYEREILAREMLDTPPAGNLLAIHGSARDPERLDRAMQAVHSFLLRYEPKKQFIGPAPEPVSRKKDMYLSVLYVRQADLQRLVWLRRMTDKFISMNEGFRNVSFQYDVNA